MEEIVNSGRVGAEKSAPEMDSGTLGGKAMGCFWHAAIAACQKQPQ